MTEKSKNQNRLESCLLFLIALNIFFAYLGIYKGRTSIPQLIGIIILGVIIFLNRKKLKLTSINKKYMPTIYILICIGMFYLIYGVIYFVMTYILYGIFFSCIIPMYMIITSNQKNSETTIIKFTRVSLTILGCSTVMCLLLAPIGFKQYEGIYGNPNLLGEFSTFAMIVTLYQYEISNKKKVSAFLFLVNFAFMLFSRSRTSLLAGMFVILFFIAYIIFNRHKHELKMYLKRFVIAGIVLVPLTFYFLSFVTPYTANFTKEIIIQSDIIKIEETGEMSFFDAIRASTERYSKGITTEGNFTSGRSEIWKEYAKEITLKGHSGKIRITEDNLDAHNTFLEVAYQLGVGGGLLFIIVFILLIKNSFKLLKKKKDDVMTFLILSVIADTVIRMMLSTYISPFNGGTLFMFWAFILPEVYKEFYKGLRGEVCL